MMMSAFPCKSAEPSHISHSICIFSCVDFQNDRDFHEPMTAVDIQQYPDEISLMTTYRQ